MLSFLHSDDYAVQEINGTEVKFYPLSVAQAFKLKNIGRNLARAFAAFYGSRQVTAGQKVRDISDIEGGTIHEFESEPLPVEALREQVEQQERGIDMILDALTLQPNFDALCSAIAESMREERENEGVSTAEMSKHLRETMNVTSILPLLKGLLAANAKQFGEPGEQISRVLTEGLAQWTGTMTEDGESSKTDSSSAFSQEQTPSGSDS